jgi:hypothetical protein
MRLFNTVKWTNSVPLSHRARLVATCAGKQWHRSEGAAQAHLRALARRYGVLPSTLQAYRCRACRGWHVGRLAPQPIPLPSIPLNSNEMHP